MSGEDPKISNQIVVTSVGNSWVVCRSKSYSGRTYYFNTLTGEAVWNLSDAEVEKAKKMSKNPPGIPLEGCPEPNEPPIDHSNFSSQYRISGQERFQNYEPLNSFNNQVINTKIIKSPFSLQTLQNSKFVPINRVETLGVNITAQPVFNPNIWAIPSTHQIYITPTTSTISNENHTSLVEYNNFHTSISPHQSTFPLSRHFSIINERRHRNHLYRRIHGYHRFSSKFYNNRFRESHPPRFRNKLNDLRQFISAKKSVEIETSESPEAKSDASSVDKIVPKEHSPTQIKYEEEELCASDVDDDWLKAHGSTEGEKYVLDVSALRNLIIPNTDSDRWFIVVDRGVILNHYKFLNTIVNSDETCQLMVAREIFIIIQNDARTDSNNKLKLRARRALRFLTQQFASGSAVIGEDPNKSPEDKNICLLNFCSKLVEQNNPLIYITHEDVWQQTKLATKVPVFTITEIKVILFTTAFSKENLQNRMPKPIDDRSIKITIPNNDFLDEAEREHCADDRVKEPHLTNESLNDKEEELDIPNDDLQNDNTVNKAVLTVKEIDIQTDTTSAMRRTVDAGVQTDFNVSEPEIVKTDSVGVNTFSNQILSNNSIQTTVDQSLNSNKRKIRLKRRTVNETTDSSSNKEKKQFKWHRRKRNFPISTSDNRDQNVLNNTGDGNQLDLNKSLPQHSSNESIFKDRQNAYEDSSETNSSTFLTGNRTENIIIEETSISDVISNSISNIDSESMISINIKKPNFNKMSEEGTSSVMFKITEVAMEEYLKMRCDEWISRFVQIMEEVLSQILQQDISNDLENTMPPPWTIHEATECIKKRFDDNCVIDAASKLSNILFKISDERGRINFKIKPAEFMEMYSYGVHLVNALQVVFDKSEDLQTAAGSLAKLLSDIHNYNLEGHNDSFNDNMNEPTCAVSQTTSTIGNQENDDPIVNNRETFSRTSSKHTEYADNKNSDSNNFRFKKRKLTEDDEEKRKDVKFIRTFDLKDTFLSTLHLKKNEMETLGSTKNQCQNESEPVSNLNSTGPASNVPSDLVADKEPRIVRNFTKCSDFEARLKGRLEKAPLDMDVLDYSLECNDDYNMEEDDYSEDYYCDEMDDEIDGEFDQSIETSHGVTSKSSECTREDNTFKLFISKFIKEIKEASKEVHNFCENTLHEINDVEKISTVKKIEIQEKVETVHLHIVNLRKSLNSIMERCVNYTESASKSLFQEAGVLLDSEQAVIYRDVIASCIGQADVLLETVNVIKDAIKS
ncbi:uncharacterized protein LOC113519095 [Galleria mellonella]|uniref:Uncharacterized protein LOC113519095 n=1 Tax=Galleria mellonella TaxID=7137 RepID=A0A6J1WV35_GALME|nr:uncharacterized protein LOC113519095 [Galleria mellonella]XP_026759955.2 uncharacterized protein LOC113519095 [Galleria mellonella]